MTLDFNQLVAVCLVYVVLLFAVAFWADRRARAGRMGWLRSPIIYTLSLSIYCTAWTFYGAVGYAARSGLEFVTIYLGPTLVMVGWWALLRKLVRIGRSQRITSIADLISSRYGKSTSLGVLVTLIVVVGTTPYIALQLQSVTLSFDVFAQTDLSGVGPGDGTDATAVWVAVGLAAFAVIFGTRNLDVNERHHGVVTAIALEAVVKLVALIAVGVAVVWVVADGPVEVFAMIEASEVAGWELRPSRWIGLTFLSAAAFLCLPRMFQVMVVENSDERHLATASWAFPLYLFAMSLFVMPIAVVGLARLPEGANADLFVLTLPLAEGHGRLAMLAFLGGFSSATSMVIVASIALATMVSNHVALPLWLKFKRRGATVSGDVRQFLLLSRRASIAGVLALGYLYYRMSGGGAALASIGLISFVGVVQILPALIGGIFWRGATRIGAAAGLGFGFSIWAWTLFLPSFGADAAIPAKVMTEGPFGIGWLRPESLFGISGLDPVVHAILWSMLVNAGAFIAGSLLSFPRPLERLQGAEFVGVFRRPAATRGWSGGTTGAEDLLVMAQRLLGAREAQALFQSQARLQGKDGYLPDATPDFLETLERKLAGSVGAATAHAMVGQITGDAAVSVEDLMRVAGETAQIMEYSARLETQRAELVRTARQLRDANDKLLQLSVQKDAFLGQISHELRTPMTSIRSLSEILRNSTDMSDVDRARFSSIIHDETVRLTRLLDDLLDLNVLEAGQVDLQMSQVRMSDMIDRAIGIVEPAGDLRIIRTGELDSFVTTDPDRLTQVFINLIGNAAKYCDAPRPELRILVRRDGDHLSLDFIDNGRGVATADQKVIFEKFARAGDTRAAGGTGLGLAICREIMLRLGGSVDYLPGQGGAAFRVRLPSLAVARTTPGISAAE